MIRNWLVAVLAAGCVGVCGGRAGAGRLDVRGDGEVALDVENSGSAIGTKAVHARATDPSGLTYGVYAENSSTSGTGVYADVSAFSGTTFGVFGKSRSPEGKGVYGYASASLGYADGVYGASNSANGRGVHGVANGQIGVNYGVYGESYSSDGTGVYGEGDDGVTGLTRTVGGRGVQAYAYATTGRSYALYAYDNSTDGTAVLGLSVAATGDTTGVYGLVSSSDGYAGYFQGGKGVYVQGPLSVTGNKQFVQPHPSDPTKEIVYVALEGPEAGTYVRGTAELRDGEARVELPEHFALVTCEESLTVQLTPVGHWLQLYVAEKGTRHLVIREASGKSGRFDYLVQGIRKGYEDHQVIRDRSPHPEPALRLSASPTPAAPKPQ